jgi:amino acid adenylation domain-containing protein/non-ribosomal peptide synthase protein (TIGR01720 family)
MAIYSEHLHETPIKNFSLVQLLQWRAASEPGRLAYRYLSDGEAEETLITYAELDQHARAIAARLQEMGASGERALLLYPTGLDYIKAFFGCLYAGVIAVPAYPPRLNRNALRLQAMAKDASATFALTNRALLSKMEAVTGQMPELSRLSWLATDTVAGSLAGAWREVRPGGESLAYLQYTSGSTATPKGVMITHGNLLHNSAGIHEGFAHSPASRSLTWLPHFHDMGLVDGIIQPLYGGFPATLMSPAAFLQRPLRWLETITRLGITHTGGPNFAYELCVRRVGAEQRAKLDLSTWRVAYNGAEPVRYETLRRFAEEFQECGFRWESFYPAYGLAEATLKVTGGRSASAPVTLKVRTDALEQNTVVEAGPLKENTRMLVGSGHAGPETRVLIVDTQALRPCAVGDVGEIWVSGPGVAAGYWNRPEETAHVFGARLNETDEAEFSQAGAYLRTGDLGFMRDGELFVTGRLKDLIIIRGRNLYPQDLELAVEESHASFRAGGGAAFAVEVGGEERLVIVQELEARQKADATSLVELIRETLAEEFEVQPYAILLVKAGSVPKTSSGKIQRNSCKSMFLAQEFKALAEWRASLDQETDPVISSEALELSGVEMLENWMRAQLAAKLRVDAASIETDAPITRYGVDSLMVIELMHSIEMRLGVRLQMAEFLRSPSIAQIAARASELLLTSPLAPSSAPATRAAEGASFPLSHGQRALWFLQQLAPESAAYNIASALRVKTELDQHALHQAFLFLVQRHPALRTTFSAPDGEPTQRIHEDARLSFQFVEASLWSEAELSERLSLEAHLPFNLEEDNLLRVVLFRTASVEHVLLVVAHHITVDFWSLAIMMHELGALYSAETSGTRATLPRPASSYADYVQGQRQLLAGEEGERLAAFWQNELGGELPVLNLRTDRPRPAAQTFRGASEPLRLDAQLTGRLKALSRANETTLFMTLLASLYALLYRYTGQEDLLVGSPSAGRSSAHFAQTIGYFVNPLVLRAYPSGALSFDEFLKQVRDRVLTAFERQEYPFDLLVKRLQPERDPSRSPLFQVMFVLNKAHLAGEEGLGAFALGEAGGRMNLGGLSLESMRLEQRISQFDLSLTMVEVGDELSASMEYNTDLFDAATIKRMLEHFLMLLEGIAARPSQTLAALPLLTERERRQLLDEWSGGPSKDWTNEPDFESRAERMEEDSPASAVHQLFEQQAVRTPDSVAVTFGDARLTYGELNARSNRLAHYLREQGVRAEVPVAICVERSLEMIVALFGVLKSGGAYVPLDPRAPQERLALMLEDTRAPLVLTQQHLVKLLPPGDARVFCLDEHWDEIAGESDDNPPLTIEPDNLAYVLYTSGSTGRPKGVMVSHRTLLAAYPAWSERYSLDSSPVVLQMANFSFDACTEDVLRALLSGGKLVLCSHETLFSPPDLYELMRAEQVELADFVPAIAMSLAQYLEETRQSLDFMRVLISGADALYREEYERLRRLCAKDARVLNSYGVTEATIDNLTFESAASNPDVDFEGVVPIGRPFANVRIYLLDDDLQLVPAGVPGELYIGGDCLARGYLNRADLTAERFIPHPFADAPGARLYKTGDLARFLPGGQVEFLGRNDHQVKIRGYRIELGEIESALREHPRVRAAIVIAGTDERSIASPSSSTSRARGEKRLIAYVVADGSMIEMSKELREFLKERLSEHMIPSAFVSLDAFPLTPNGKVDRRALPAPDFSHAGKAQAGDEPQTPVERALSNIWSRLLKLERVSVNDNFFELGGDSILSIQVIARARREGIHLKPRQMFEHPTIAALASVAQTTALIQPEQNRITGQLPLTPIARWFFEQDFPAPDYWNMSLLLETKERLDHSLVEQTIARLLEHHDALRLRFVREKESWRQFIAGEEDAARCLRHVDLSTQAEAQQRVSIETIAAETQSQLSLSNGPLIRVVLFDLGEDRTQRLLIVIHHLAIDGVSWRILLEDWEQVYRQLQRGVQASLPSKTTSFKHWAERLEQHSQAEELKRELDYWTSLPWQTARVLPRALEGDNQEGSARTIAVSLNSSETRSLVRDVPLAYHTQIEDVLLCALARALQRWTGAHTLLLELEGHGREEIFEDVDISRTVGWFTNTFPLMLELEETTTTGEALKSTKEQLRRIPQNGIGYGLLRYLSGDSSVARSMRAIPQPEVSFNYLGQLDQMFDDSTLFALASESCGPARDHRAARNSMFEINASITGGHLRAEWTHSALAHEGAIVEKLASDFIEELRELIAHCLSTEAGGHTPSDFPLAHLGQRALDELLKMREGVSDIYPLSPMQHGMLFHSLYAPGTGVYMGQFSCALQGEVDRSAFEAAWQQVIERHESLRAAFVWENMDEPLQLIHKSVRVPLEEHDWRALSEPEQEARWESLLSDEQRRGFNLSTPPLVRLALVRVGPERYLFAWTHHHLLLDGWSGALVLREVFAAYEALRRGERMRFEPHRPFRDYIEWLSRQDLSKAEAFWRENLAGLKAVTPLVVNRARASTSDGVSEFGERTLRLSKETTNRLGQLARQHQLTLSTLLQGAWALLLSRYSAQERVVFGATVSGRPPALPGVDSMVGLFINTLPVRVSVDEDARLIEWLKLLQAEQVELREYESSPLVLVQSWSEAPRGEPLFESLLVFENYPLDADALKENLSLKLNDIRSFDRTNYPLTIVAIPLETLSLQALYDRQAFADDAIERMLGHLQMLLEEMAHDSSRKLADLSLLTQGEKHQSLVEWNATARDYRADLCMHEMFEEQARRTPQRIAVVHGQEELTYRELNERGNKLARSLRESGVGPETRVAVCMERSTLMLAGMLAVWKAGGAYVPLDPEYPQERLAFMLEDSGAQIVLTQERLLARLPAHGARAICVDTSWSEIDEAASADNLERIATSRNLAYVIYTSGSTGRPKGTAIEHRSAALFSQWAVESFGPEAFAGTLALSSICFDLSIFELFVPLHCGGKVIIVRDSLHFNDAPAAHEVTLINCVPSVMNELLQLDCLPASARIVNLAGEALPGKLVQQLYEQKNIEQVFNLYGPTEDTTYSTCALMRGDVTEPPTIGRPISNTQAYMLDHRGRPVPVGVPGEVYLGGMGLARGYLERPELTADKFIPDPFSQEPGARLYRTGDLARFLPDGRIDFLGRIDHQVKIRGYRIELGEIETILSKHPSLKASVVVARADALGQQRLVAYVVTREGKQPTQVELREYSRERMLKHMIPAAFVLLDQLPLTPNGKINRRALPEPEATGSLNEEQYIAPRDFIEEALADLWQEILGVESVGVRNNFFDLGGHSLIATRLSSRVRKLFRIELPLSVLFEATTIEEQAQALVKHETRPGQTLKIARVLHRIKTISGDDLKNELEQKRREKSGV